LAFRDFQIFLLIMNGLSAVWCPEKVDFDLNHFAAPKAAASDQWSVVSFFRPGSFDLVQVCAEGAK
jgi:hypothetical protein